MTSLLDIWGGDWTAENIGPINFHEANLLNLDISKAKFNLNWRTKMVPTTDFRKYNRMV